MSRMGSFALELQEFVEPLVYDGYDTEQITEIWKHDYKNTDYHDMGLMYLNGAIKTAEQRMFGLHYVDYDEAVNREV